ncbi:MAG: alkaline phosphatase family protein [Acidobacteriota bacterium]
MERRKFIKNSILLSSGLGLSYCGVDVDDKTRVVILGFDGANWATIDPLIDKGKLPYLKKLKEESAWGDFKTIKPTKSNVVWTSIVTGKTMLKHGILDFSFLKKNGVKVPYSKSERKEPALWQILDTYNKKSVVVNWWVSHPPDKINGIMLSDHFRRIANQGSNINDFKPTIHPETYFEKLKGLAEENKNYQKVIKRIGLPDFPKKFMEIYPKGKVGRIPVLNIYKRLAKHDAMVESASRYLKNNVNSDFFATYFRFPDITQHFVTHFMDKKFKAKLKKAYKSGDISSEMIAEATEMVSEILFPIYRYMESIIKEYITTEKNKNTYFMIMSDHGFSFYDGGYNHYSLPEGYPAPDGIFMLNGPKVVKGKIKDVGVYDVAPTVLNLFDLPVGKNMDGKVLKSTIRTNNKIRFKTYTMKKYDGKKVNDKFQKETIEELKSIGYI